MPKMDLPSLRALLDAQYSAALASSNSTLLSGQRAKALAYYNGDVSSDLPTIVGRSAAVSMDVSDAIEGIMPQLMEVFVGSDEVVKFEPVGPEDVQAAEQETDYINHVFMNQNPGFLVLYSFIKDALLSKVGVVKVWWEKQIREERETYYDKTDDEYALIAASPDVEIEEHSAHAPGETPSGDRGEYGGDGDGSNGIRPDSGTQSTGNDYPSQPGSLGGIGGAQPQLHDVTVVVKRDYSQAKVLGVPPEEFGIDPSARSIRDCNYCYHKVVNLTAADLIGQGVDEDVVANLPSYRAWSNTEETSRDTVAESLSLPPADQEPATRKVEIVEHYIRMDYEGRGEPCLYQVTTAGQTGEVLTKSGKPMVYEWDEIPFAAMTPIIMTHRFYGKSLADLVMDIMRIKTSLLRGALDGLYTAVAPTVVVSELGASENTLDDLLNRRPNQIVRVKGNAADTINYQTSPDVSQMVYPALEYMDQIREWRTGISKQSQGLDANALVNQSATAVNQAFSASQARVRLIARIFAETGIRDLFWLLHATIKKHADKSSVVRLKNNWITVDPRNFKTRDDLTIHVGLGTGSKAEQVARLTIIANLQEKCLAGGLPIVTPDNAYNTGVQITKAIGHQDTNAFFTDPKTLPPQPPKPDPETIKVQGQLAIQQQKQQADVQKSQIDTQHQVAKNQAEIVLAQKKFEFDQQLAMLQHNLKLEEIRVEAQRKAAEHAMDMQHKQEVHAMTLHTMKVKAEQPQATA